ncbi:MAG: DUF4249 family protein [Bacteroidales bacterium]|nr:DUF4249 family protein [Bacteroidales bacterium]
MKTILYIALISILFTSCETVIDVDLNSTDSKVVIEGSITNQPGPYTIKITQTTDYFIPSNYPAMQNAIVNISDDDGHFETLIEVEPGIYQTASIQGTTGHTYNLYININDQEYTASSYLPTITPIDSLAYFESPFSPHNTGDGNFRISCYFHDDENEENYYRFKLYNNSVLSEKFYLLDDQLQNGRDIDYGRLQDEINLNDTVVVELVNIDEGVYNYFNTLSSIVGSGGMSSSIPANPNSNISNGALGYFGAFSFTCDTIIIN